MPLIDINWNPNRKDIRSFGLIGLVVLTAVSLVLFFVKGFSLKVSVIIFLLGVLVFLSSIISFKLTRLIYLGLTFLTFPIGLFISFLLMSIFYYCLITPLGIFFRLIGRDPLNRRFEPDMKSYWIERKKITDIKRYFHQF